MTAYAYRVVPLPVTFPAGVRIWDAVPRAMESIVMSNAVDGWEFVGCYPYSVQQPAGCLGSLFGAGTTYATFTMAVFRRSTQ